MQLCTVVVMCPLMSLAAIFLFKRPSIGVYIVTLLWNLPMALGWQLLVAGHWFAACSDAACSVRDDPADHMNRGRPKANLVRIIAESAFQEIDQERVSESSERMQVVCNPALHKVYIPLIVSE